MNTDGLVAHYLDVIEEHPHESARQVADLIFWRLNDEEILDAAAAALRECDMVESACALALRHLSDLVDNLDRGYDGPRPR